jgi:hypothetical protein
MSGSLFTTAHGQQDKNNTRKKSAPSAPSAVNAVFKHPTSPEKDYTKVANSIVRQIPNGLFPGKSKLLYDYLYSLTRGAIKPVRTVRVSKSGLMKGAGIKSTHTFYNNMRHLESIGLVLPTRIDGEHGGNMYEIMLPEEINLDLVHLAQLGQLTQLAQKLPVAVNADSALAALGSESTNTGVSDAPKTSFKDKIKIDDEFVPLRELGGSAEDWREFVNLLISEYDEASAKTKVVSNAPKFLTAHFRKLISKPIRSDRHKPSDVPKEAPTAIEPFVPAPLSSKGREVVLQSLRKMSSEDMAEHQASYTPEDWEWLQNSISHGETYD